MRKKRFYFLLTVIFFLWLAVFPQMALASFGYRSMLSIVGSSTVYPFATAVAERFSLETSLRTPRVQATGSGGGFQLFCAGVGFTTPDITTSSRPATASELALCAANGVDDIAVVEIGYDGIVLVNSGQAPPFHLMLKDVYLALADKVPAGDKGIGKNSITHWRQLAPFLPDIPIRVYGPPLTSGTRDDFVRLIMKEGALLHPFFAEIDTASINFTRLFSSMRSGGYYINAGENDSTVIERLLRNPNLLGITGYSFFDQNRSLLHAATLEGIKPTPVTIQSGSYPGSRLLYLYVKKAHIGRIPGIRRYLEEFTAERSWGEKGYLVRKGMIPLKETKRKANRAKVEVLAP